MLAEAVRWISAVRANVTEVGRFAAIASAARATVASVSADGASRRLETRATNGSVLGVFELEPDQTGQGWRLTQYAVRLPNSYCELPG